MTIIQCQDNTHIHIIRSHILHYNSNTPVQYPLDYLSIENNACDSPAKLYNNTRRAKPRMFNRGPAGEVKNVNTKQNCGHKNPERTRAVAKTTGSPREHYSYYYESARETECASLVTLLKRRRNRIRKTELHMKTQMNKNQVRNGNKNQHGVLCMVARSQLYYIAASVCASRFVCVSLHVLLPWLLPAF